MSDPWDVIYLTGAPATGKSTLAERLKSAVPNLEIFNYGQELTRFLSEKSGALHQQSELRSQSSNVITPADVDALDSLLLERVERLRGGCHVIIDTHAVTKEQYGFRVTPFSLARFAQLRPTKIVVLYTTPETAIARIVANPDGRPMITAFESGFHNSIQASVAISYGTSLGIPIYFLDSDRDQTELIEWFHRHVSVGGKTHSDSSPPVTD